MGDAAEWSTIKGAPLAPVTSSFSPNPRSRAMAFRSRSRVLSLPLPPSIASCIMAEMIRSFTRSSSSSSSVCNSGYSRIRSRRAPLVQLRMRSNGSSSPLLSEICARTSALLTLLRFGIIKFPSVDFRLSRACQQRGPLTIVLVRR